MPLLDVNDYQCAQWLRNPHINTILPTLIRTVKGVEYSRQRIDTPDGDFIDVDWSKKGSKKLVVVLHGLEGNSERHYMQGMVKMFNREGWDALALNHRGCSGEPPRTSQIYHGGFTDDLRLMIANYAGGYDQIALVGFSLGGNMVLKYLGEEGDNVNNRISAAVAISVPIDLVDGAVQLNRMQNIIYVKRFLRTLKEKIKLSEHLYRDKIDLQKVYASNTIAEFDNHMTGPALGFDSAQGFYEFAMCKPYLPNIKVPTLLVNAQDDTFLGDQCYPQDLARNNKYLFLQVPKYGGHVGFKSKWREDDLWSERNALGFITKYN